VLQFYVRPALFQDSTHNLQGNPLKKSGKIKAYHCSPSSRFHGLPSSNTNLEKSKNEMVNIKSLITHVTQLFRESNADVVAIKIEEMTKRHHLKTNGSS